MSARRRVVWTVAPGTPSGPAVVTEAGPVLVPSLLPDLPPRRRPAVPVRELRQRVVAFDTRSAVEERGRAQQDLHTMLRALRDNPPPPPATVITGYPGRPDFSAPPGPSLDVEALAGGRQCGTIEWDDGDGGG